MTNWLELLVGETRTRLLTLLRRSQLTITRLSDELNLTDNAVRTHVAALGRDGLVEQVGTQRDTGGKPARVYALTQEGEDLFPKAYGQILNGLVEEITCAAGPDQAEAILRAVGSRTAARVAVPDTEAARVEAAAATLRELGGDVEVLRTDAGWRLQGYACPLSAVTAEHPSACALATALVAGIVTGPVTECCERGERPRCAFVIEAQDGPGEAD